MKVLLVQSYLGPGEEPVFPLGLEYLKNSLGTAHEVRTFDTNTFASPFEALAERLREFAPDVVGISLRNIDSTNKRKVVFYYDFLKDALRVVTEQSEAKIVVGGSGFSMFASEIMAEEPAIDYGVFLEGERTFPELLENLDKPEAVPGVYFRVGGAVKFTGKRDHVDVNTATMVNLKAEDMKPYNGHVDAVGIQTKRGCMLKCVYCIYGFLNGTELRLKDPSIVVDEIEAIAAAGRRSFTFVDAVFNIPLKHAEAICREIIDRGLDVTWSAWFHERFLNADFIGLLKLAGCNKIILSPDGFSDNVLKLLGKDIKQKETLDLFEVFRAEDGFEVCYNFFKNPPGQDLATFLRLVYFCIRAKLFLGRRVHFEFNSIRVEPHTKMYKIALDDGFIKADESLLYPKYYTNPGTRYIEKIFNLMLRLKGM